MVLNAWHGPFLTSWRKNWGFRSQTGCVEHRNSRKGSNCDENEKGNRGKIVRRTIVLHTVSMDTKIYSLFSLPLAFFLLSLPFSCLFFFSCSKLQLHCWCILRMIIHWERASVAEHAQGSLIPPAVIDKNKRSGRRRGARIPPSYNKERRQTPHPPEHCLYGRHSTCLPWKLLNPHLTLGKRYTEAYWS